MKKITVSVLIIFFLSSFTSFANFVGYTNQGVEKIATPILNRILSGIKENNYKTYSSDFSEAVKSVVTKEKFLSDNKKIEDALGNYLSKEYLGYLCVNNMNVVLWKAKFSKTSNDVLIKLVLDHVDNKAVVMGLFFE